MKALITGGNGFLGSALAKRLIARGDEVVCLLRKGSDASRLDGLAVRFVEGDVTDTASLPAAVAGMDVVFHLAGIRRAAGREDFIRVNAEGTRNVCEAMLAAPGEKKARLVFCGSLAAAGPSREDITEEKPLEPTEWYGESKAEAEKIVLSFADRLPVTIARPARILGPGDHENLPFFKIVKKGFRLKVGGGPRRLAVIDVEDVVDALLLQAEHPNAVGQAFFIAHKDVSSLEGLQDHVAQALKIEPKTITLPEPILMGLAQAADVVTNFTGKKLPLNRKLARQLLAPGWSCSIEKAEKLLGFKPRVDIAESMKRSAEWYVKEGWL